MNEQQEFVIDTKDAGNAKLNVSVTDSDQKPVDVNVKDNKDGTFTCTYTPKKAVKHVVVATFGDVVIQKFPYRVTLALYIIEISCLKVLMTGIVTNGNWHPNNIGV